MVVNQQGEILTDTQTPAGEEQIHGNNEVAALGSQPAVEYSDPKPLSKEHEEFIRYNQKIRNTVVMPQVGEADFCKKMRRFIETRGDGMASSDQLVEAYNLFQNVCVEKKEEEKQPSQDEKPKGTIDEGIGLPVPSQNSVGETQIEEQNIEQSPIISEYLARDKKVLTFDEDIGLRPSGGKMVSETEYQIKKVNNNPMLYFLVILGVATIIYAVNKKD